MNPFETIDPREAWRLYEPDERFPWDRRRAARLLRRAGLGATTIEIDAAVKSSPTETIQRVMDATVAPQFATELENVTGAALATNDSKNLGASWLYRMLHSPAQAVEKLTLFWHGHFATSAAKVTDPRLMLEQHQLLRNHAFGPFHELTIEMARNPAMLIFLDSVTNRRSRPNENFSREVMELFCLGLGNYTERDIQELARCFTGWEVHQGKFRFYAAQHDRGDKEFLGRRGAFGGEQGVQIVLDQPAAARFIVRKLIQLYVCDEPTPPDALLEPLAEQLRQSGWFLKPVVQTILGSRLLLASSMADRRVQSPVELAVSWCRALDVRIGTQQLGAELAALGQSLFHPPNVKGWPGGRSWLNSATIVGRANLLGRIARAAAQHTGSGNLATFADRQGWRTNDELVTGFETLLLARPLDDDSREQARARLAQPGGERTQQIADMLQVFALLPEVNLS